VQQADVKLLLFSLLCYCICHILVNTEYQHVTVTVFFYECAPISMSMPPTITDSLHYIHLDPPFAYSYRPLSLCHPSLRPSQIQNPFTGMLDEIRIWIKSRADREVAEWYQYSISRNSHFGMWDELKSGVGLYLDFEEVAKGPILSNHSSAVAGTLKPYRAVRI
jgi:hypothetical protein